MSTDDKTFPEIIADYTNNSPFNTDSQKQWLLQRFIKLARSVCNEGFLDVNVTPTWNLCLTNEFQYCLQFMEETFKEGDIMENQNSFNEQQQKDLNDAWHKFVQESAGIYNQEELRTRFDEYASTVEKIINSTKQKLEFNLPNYGTAEEEAFLAGVNAVLRELKIPINRYYQPHWHTHVIVLDKKGSND